MRQPINLVSGEDVIPFHLWWGKTKLEGALCWGKTKVEGANVSEHFVSGSKKNVQSLGSFE